VWNQLRPVKAPADQKALFETKPVDAHDTLTLTRIDAKVDQLRGDREAQS
jgi:hypothetical protein